MSHNGWELNPIPERSDQKAAFHPAVPNYFDKSALALASSLIAGPTLMLSSVFGALMKSDSVPVEPSSGLYLFLPRQALPERIGERFTASGSTRNSLHVSDTKRQ